MKSTKFNITIGLLVIIVVGLSLLLVNKSIESRRYRRALSDKTQEANLERLKLIDYHSAKYRNATEALRAGMKALDEERVERQEITSLYRQEKAKVKNYTGDSLYKLIIQGKELDGKRYDIDSSIMSVVVIEKLGFRECLKINSSLASENQMLDRYVVECLANSDSLVKGLTECERTKVDLSAGLEEEVLKKKKYRSKLWTNRGIAGVAVAVLVVIAVL